VNKSLSILPLQALQVALPAPTVAPLIAVIFDEKNRQITMGKSSIYNKRTTMSYRFHFFLSFFLGFQDPTSNFYIMFRLGGMATTAHWSLGGVGSPSLQGSHCCYQGTVG
jgi:hypothetical protein